MLSWREFLRGPAVTAPAAPGVKTSAFLGAIALVWLGFWLAAVTGPCDLADGDHQERQAAYVLDVLINGNWACQQNQIGELCGKPPLYTWLATGLSLPFDRITRFTLFFPGALAVLVIMLAIAIAGRRHFGVWAGAFGALAFVLSPSGTKMLDLARIDGLFAGTVFVAAILAFNAWQTGRGWTWFWLAAAAATLAKGPLGLVLAAGGLLAHLWERRTDPTVRLRGSHWVGIAAFFLLTLGWFLLAYAAQGQALLDRMFGNELIHEAVKAKRGYAGPLKPTLYVVLRFFPWSLLAAVGVWRVFSRPAAAPGARRLERFLVCYLLFGLLLFSLGAHQRPDLVFPLLPAVALLAGREVARWLQPETEPRFLRRLTVALVLCLGGFLLYTDVLHRDETIDLTRGVRQLATRFDREYGRSAPLLICQDAPVTFQVFLNTFRPQVSYEKAARRLAGPEPAMVLVAQPAKLRALLPPGTTCYEVMGWKAPRGKACLAVLGNREGSPPGVVDD